MWGALYFATASMMMVIMGVTSILQYRRHQKQMEESHAELMRHLREPWQE